jgi:hypothetical protein
MRHKEPPGERSGRSALSKSTFLRGVQCPKSLYLHAHHPELRDPIDESRQAVFAGGHDVGLAARDRFPGGVLASALPLRAEQAIRRTADLIRDGAYVLYEPAFEYGGVFVACDILVRDRRRWALYEVKAHTEVKEEDLRDVAVQAWVLRGAGIDLAETAVLHLNNKYVRQGNLDLGGLFVAQSVRSEVDDLQQEVAARVVELKAVLAGEGVPTAEIGPQCDDPWACDFRGHCWAHIPSPSVFDLAGVRREARFGLYRRGIVRLEDVPDGERLPAAARVQIDLHKNPRTVIDRSAIRKFLRSLGAPLGFLDFETFMPAIPPFDGTSPYQQIPFQFSLHTRQAPGGPLRHAGFLAEGGEDPRRALAEALLHEMAGLRSVVVYNQSFEDRVLASLAAWLPEHAKALEGLRGRLVDLMEPFRRRDYCLPSMAGSYSIKAVLPALVPGLAYGDLEVSDGQMAMQAYAALSQEADPVQREILRQALWAYCERDTEGMVRIVEVLEREGGPPVSLRSRQ